MRETFMNMTPDLLYQCIYAGLILTAEERAALVDADPAFSRAVADAEVMREDKIRRLCKGDLVDFV